jgi:hypothetical protein
VAGAGEEVHEFRAQNGGIQGMAQCDIGVSYANTGTQLMAVIVTVFSVFCYLKTVLKLGASSSFA